MVQTITGWTPLSTAIAESLSSTSVLGVGWVVLATRNSTSRLATGGRTNTFLRGAISAMTEAPFSVSSVTSSPATGVIFCLRKMPLGLHSTMPSGVLT